MPLSEHEQRLLEQMERQLYADDPKLASTLRGSGRSLRTRHQVVFGIVGIAIGLALLVAGVAAQLWPLGAAGAMSVGVFAMRHVLTSCRPRVWRLGGANAA